jgi:GNAT superfamily N-acetyltransferase
LIIRRYREQDFDALTILWRISRERSVPDFQRRKGHFFYEDREYFKNHILQKDQVWVWEENQISLAFLALRHDFIDQLYVHPDAWWKGIGTQLLDFARTLSPNHLWLYTLQVNQQARSFYEKNSFVAEKFGTSPPPENEPDVEYHWRPIDD